MMASPRYNSNDARRQVGSPRPKGGRDTKDTLCRNIVIYGHCRYEDSGCSFNHDQGKSGASDMSANRLTGDSPAFTPSAPKRAAFAPHNASAAPFTPRAAAATTAPVMIPPPEMDTISYTHPATIPDYTTYGAPSNGMGMSTDQSTMDAFAGMQSMASALPGMGAYANGVQYDGSGMLGNQFDSFQNRAFNIATPTQPAMYHLYSPVGPEPQLKGRGNVKTPELFLPNDLREELQKMSAASLQVLPASQLPVTVGDFSALVPLDTTTHRKNTTAFGYNTWVYKAFYNKNGRPYCLRRLEEFYLSNANAVRKVNEWRSIYCANIVHTEDAFTCKEFGDASLVFVQDYYPLSKTLAETHFNSNNGTRYQRAPTSIPEPTLWSYLTQFANALRVIHGASLAARCIDPTKIIVTEKGRVRLAGCAILDVVQFGDPRPIAEFQQQDFDKVGRVMLALATGNVVYSNASIQVAQVQAAFAQVQRSYKPQLAETIQWLLSPTPGGKTVQELMARVQAKAWDDLDTSLLRQDRLRFELGKSLEHGRVARLAMKLEVISGRSTEPFNHSENAKWGETEARYICRLFRDYVFHQVDANGAPVLDLCHMMECLNKADSGSEEQICLVTPNEQSVLVLSFSEVKKQIGNAFMEVAALANTTGHGSGGGGGQGAAGQGGGQGQGRTF